MKKELTCIVCPLGCNLSITKKNGSFEVAGNTCPRGKNYAIAECTAPTRTVTSTMKCENGCLLPVKTDKPIPKDKIMECMSCINQKVVPLPIAIGDVIIDDVFGSKIVATKNISL